MLLRNFVVFVISTLVFLNVSFCAPNTNSPPSKANGTTTTTKPAVTTTPTPPKNESATAAYATIYVFSHFIGPYWSFDLSDGCANIRGFFYRKASSIDTHDNCVLIYAGENCTNLHVKIEPGTNGHSSLADVDFDDKISSLQLCSSEKNKPTDKLKEKEKDKPKERKNNTISQAHPVQGGNGSSTVPRRNKRQVQIQLPNRISSTFATIPEVPETSGGHQQTYQQNPQNVSLIHVN